MPDDSHADVLVNPWTANAYKASSSFVPLLATKVTEWLAPRSYEKILDLGCGDGVLTATLKPLCSEILAIDSSPDMITAAMKDFAAVKGIEWMIKDCRRLDDLEAPLTSDVDGGTTDKSREERGFDQVFSSAALHWILRDQFTRVDTLRNVYRLLRHQGTFVFEMGGPSNVAEVHAALLSALQHQGVPLAIARDICPWYFPSEQEMKDMLEGTGFTVEKSEVAHRPTRLTEGVKGGGLDGWIRLHGQAFLQAVGEEKRDAVVREVCEVLESVVSRDGGQWLGYVRLRMLARKATTK